MHCKWFIKSMLLHVMPSIFFSSILWSDAFVYNSYFFSEQPFYGDYSTLDSHTKTVISHARLHVKKVTRSVVSCSSHSRVTFATVYKQGIEQICVKF